MSWFVVTPPQAMSATSPSVAMSSSESSVTTRVVDSVVPFHPVCTESLASKNSRPFLLAGEVGGSHSSMASHAKGKRKKDKNTLSKVFSVLGAGMPSMRGPRTDNVPYKIVQTIEVLQFHLSSVSVPTFTAKQFNLGLVDQATQLAAVFDQYRISGIEVWLAPSYSSATTNASGLFTSVVDYDDATALTTVASALDYENALTSEGISGHYHKFVPHVAVASYSGTFVSFNNVTAPWIDAASSTVQHYGIKTAWPATVAVYAYDLVAKLHMEFRNVR